jgi:hypothetical protein
MLLSDAELAGVTGLFITRSSGISCALRISYYRNSCTVALPTVIKNMKTVNLIWGMG